MRKNYFFDHTHLLKTVIVCDIIEENKRVSVFLLLWHYGMWLNSNCCFGLISVYAKTSHVKSWFCNIVLVHQHGLCDGISVLHC